MTTEAGKVRRFGYNCEIGYMEEYEEGEYVEYADYEASERLVSELKQGYCAALDVLGETSLRELEANRRIAELEQQVAELIKVSSGEVQHLLMGACPDLIEGYDVRDDECDACKIMIRAEGKENG